MTTCYFNCWHIAMFNKIKKRNGEIIMNNVKETIRDYISRVAFDSNFKDDDNLFELGVVHSLFAVQLILFIEKEFDIELDEDEINFDNIKSINDIVALIDSRNE